MLRLLTPAVAVLSLVAQEARFDPLYPSGAPGALGSQDRDKPGLFLYPANASPSGTAIIVCPGGGYTNLAVDHEGRQIARWLNSLGISAYILRYRHAPYRHPIPLRDAQTAVRTVRARAKEWNIRPDRIGILGFSAGGHLAATVATSFDSPENRPDFAVLAYPVIAFGEAFTHRGSQRNLLGDKPDPSLVRKLSAEKNVTSETPPTFLFHTTEDIGVPPENSIVFYLALRKAGVPAEMHIYEKGRHGVGLAPKDPILSTWPARLADWFRTRGLLD
jgi:acetyl esterase/lipase